MKPVLDATSGGDASVRRIGGKARALFRLAREGFSVPDTLVIPTDVYEAFVEANGLRERILLEINRKDFEQMRWEEIWDASLRIRGRFLTAAMPEPMAREIADAASRRFGDAALVVRSSAPGEDAGAASFAGLHETVVNVGGGEPLLEAVRKVWASLWSDAALLYRQELGLDPGRSAMAVILQPMASGRSSGVVFTRNPSNGREALVEAVHGLNQGLVDGAVEPDRWHVDRRSKVIVSHREPVRERAAVAGPQGVALTALGRERKMRAPLDDREVIAILETALSAEHLFGSPQDVEWTLAADRPTVLQSRPVTAGSAAAPDSRAWYLSLHRSFDNLVALREAIEGVHLPEMDRDAEAMRRMDLTTLADGALAEEIRRRRKCNDRWVQVYWSEFIPFAHGIRLFGQVYNDAVRPEDPFAFVELLSGTPLQSLDRNRRLGELVDLVRGDPDLRARLERRRYPPEDHPFMAGVAAFIERYGDLSCSVGESVECAQGPEALVHVVLEWSEQPEGARPLSRAAGGRAREARFLDAFDGDQRRWAERLLDLGRASYRLRDDDNIHLGRIEAAVTEAEREALRRLSGDDAAPSAADRLQLREVMDEKPVAGPLPAQRTEDGVQGRGLRARQLVGQPAGPGLARGRARVVSRPEDLLAIRRGEVLVVDAVDPNMTFVVPLASAVVERRGGMLIHGAIIAREYGLACVTGVPQATELIRTGDLLTVDGYLGIVTVAPPASERS